MTLAELEAKRYELRDIAAGLLPEERVATCGRYVVPGENHMEIWHSEANGGAWFGNLETCSASKMCPVCGARIGAERRAELRIGVERAQALGWYPVLVTFTLQHSRRDSLRVLVDALNDSLRRVKRGAPWQRFKDRCGVQGDIKAFEVLHGGYGWHPHYHAALFLDHEPDAQELREAKKWLTERYGRFLRKHHGRYCSDLHGIDVRTGAEVVDYLTKWNLDAELAAPEAKNGHGRTPFQLLAAYKDGDKQAGALFREYAAVTKGMQQLRWSNGLRDALGIDPDAIEADPAEDGRVLMTLTRKQWGTVCKARAQADLLRVAALGDPEKCWVLLKSIGVRPAIGRATGDRPPPRARAGPQSSGGTPYATNRLGKQLERTEILRDLYERGVV